MTVAKWQPGTAYLPGALVSRSNEPPFNVGVIENSDFESGDMGWIKGTSWAIDQAGAYTGTWSAAYSGAGVGAVIENDNYAEIDPGQSVTLKALCDRGSDPAGQAFGQVQLVFYDASYNLIAGYGGPQNDNGGDGEWRQVSVTHIAPALTAYVRASAIAYTTLGTVRFDSFTWNLAGSPAGDGFVFKAVQAESGLSGTSEPVWPVTVGGTVVDNEVTWESVAATTVTWEASPLLVSGGTEPIWPTVSGSVVSDGSISWETVRMHIEDPNCPHTREVAIGASKIFAGDYDIVRFSATLNARDWSTQEDAGFIPSGLHQGEQVGVTALGVYRGNLAIWSDSSFQVWQIDPDPSAMALLDAMEGIGSAHHKAVQPVSNDLFFLAALGVRTVGVAAASTNLAAGDAGVPIDTLVQASMDGTVDPIATYYPSMGQYWLAFPPYTESEPGVGEEETPEEPVDPEDLFVTSKPYPVYAFDSITEDADTTQAGMIARMIQPMSESVDVQSGTLTHKRTYGSFDGGEDYLTESADCISGAIKNIIGYRSFKAPEEFMTETADVQSATLNRVLGLIGFEAEEYMTESADCISGTLTAV